MELKIGSKVDVLRKNNCFEIEVTMMHGDADSYTIKYIVIPEERLDLTKEAVVTLIKMDNVPWNDRREEYYNIDLWQKWFGPSYYGEWTSRISRQECEEAHQYSFEWDSDVTCDHQYLSALDSYKVFYYDEIGDKYNVEVIY